MMPFSPGGANSDRRPGPGTPRLTLAAEKAILGGEFSVMKDDKIDSLAGLLADTRSVAVLTGAGISAESGVPTFRGPEGLWKEFRAEELATPEAFARDPALVWEWYDWRRGLIAPVEPNPGHQVLAGWESLFDDFSLITQNVDGLHRKAGSRKVIELHGNIWKLRCTRENTIFDIHDTPLPKIPPACPDCGAMLRPHVVWFGEGLDPEVLDAAFAASAACRAMFVVGTSAVVQPAASLPLVAARAGARIIEINLEPTPLTARADLYFPGRAGEILPLLDRRIRAGRRAGGAGL
jgi:NAD-dependent deacetylase